MFRNALRQSSRAVVGVSSSGRFAVVSSLSSISASIDAPPLQLGTVLHGMPQDKRPLAVFRTCEREGTWANGPLIVSKS